MRLILIDDDPVVTSSLKTILEAEDGVTVAGTGANGDDAVALYHKHKPDVALLDIQMGDPNGLEAGRQILHDYPDAKILFLTTFSDDEYIIKALDMGAKGYMLKQDFDKIVPALRTVMAGQSVLGGDIITKIPTLMERAAKTDFSAYGIEEKELQIIQMVADGLSNKEIAQTIYLGEGTVRNYISTILDKLNLRDRTQLAVFYYRNK